MTKRLICLISFITLMFTLFSVSYADDEKQTEVYVDGAKIEFDIQPQDTGYDYMMIPIRAVADHFGAEVSWDETEQSVTLLTQKGTITLTVGSNRLIRNEETIGMWTPAIMIDGRMLIHYRRLEDCFNVHTNWDTTNNIVTITTDNSFYDVMKKKK